MFLNLATSSAEPDIDILSFYLSHWKNTTTYISTFSKMQAFSVVAVVFLSAGAAARFTSSRATATVAPASPALDGMTPKPTLGHMFMDHEMLFRRQDTDDVIYVAPDETCGYLQGSSQYPLTCGVSSTCSAIPALNGMACCGDEFCRARFRCLDYSKAFNTRSCDSSCWDDPMTLKW